jgi:uncharacterized protein
MNEHPNLAVVRNVGAAIQRGNFQEIARNVTDDVVWHYFNPRLPELANDYSGIAGVRSFFGELARRSQGTFTVEPVSADAIGDQLVVTHARISLSLDGAPIRTDAVVVWRVADGRVAEVWDIPSVGKPAKPAAGGRQATFGPREGLNPPAAHIVTAFFLPVTADAGRS